MNDDILDREPAMGINSFEKPRKQNKSGIAIGSKWNNRVGRTLKLTPFKIMGMVENWVVMRRKRCTPTVEHINDFGNNKQFTLEELCK